jgi:hypothetical protein
VKGELIIALASAVMSHRRVTLALEVLARGPHALDRAIELAGTVLRNQLTATSEAHDGGTNGSISERR